MSIFFLQYKVLPLKTNNQYGKVKGAYASCFVDEQDEKSAHIKASFYVCKSDWEIDAIESYPVVVKRSGIRGKDLGTENYDRACEDGIAICYVAWARDSSSKPEVLELNPSSKFNLGKFLKDQKKYHNTGRCLHFGSGVDCKNIINAHSIQRSQSLSNIAVDGHVYMLSADFSDLKRSKGKPSFRKIGINNASTFLGFCEKHDNELFEAIDNLPLLPTNQQVLLYAYRSLCRELFVKHNSVLIFEKQRKEPGIPDFLYELMSGIYEGAKFGLANLNKIKKHFDNSIQSNNHHDICYTIFNSSQKAEFAFSGLFFPDYDFLGRKLQDLGNHNKDLSLITFCSAPNRNGWSYLFAWHNKDNEICEEFMRSIATRMHDGENLGDLLFRLVILCCENLAISPKWFESLADNQLEEIVSNIAPILSPFCEISSSYLCNGLERMVGWEFDVVLSTME